MGLDYQLPKDTRITKEIAVAAPMKTWEMVESQLSRGDFIDACEELAADFQIRADAAREDQAAEDAAAFEEAGD